MKVPLSWLREYVDITLSPSELADRLTMAGLEVGGMQVFGANWDNIIVGQIITINPHPNADRLHLVTVDLGAEQQTVVCGAPNIKINDKIVFAHVGAQLIDGHTGKPSSLKAAKIRGVASSGMVCSEKELGISDNHEGIMVLSAEAEVGTSVSDYLSDIIFDIEVTPNRPDCLSIIGIAREVSALTGGELHLPMLEYTETTLPIDQQISVEIVAPDLCPRYCASLTMGVKVAPSPKWMQQRLLACGMRPINNIVDITNYVMLEYGQPLHAFDYNLISGKKIIVRRAAEGEVLVTLDNVTRILSKEMLVIADEERTIALAGVMGGTDSEVTQQTVSILLEAASFNSASIHHTGRSLWLGSEACMRFERGISPELTLLALRRATQLIIELAGAEAAMGLADVYPGKQNLEPILLSVSYLNDFLGTAFTLSQVMQALTSLGFDCEPVNSAPEILVTIPYWRSDIKQTVDLIEEVARVIGYDKIPSTLLSQPLPRQTPEPIISFRQEVRCGLVGYGFHEVITYSLTSMEMLNKLQPEAKPLESMPLRLANPMTNEQEYLRPNLRINLLTALSANRKHEDGTIMLFELGKVYLPRPEDLPHEPDVLCAVLSGPRVERSWFGSGKSLDFFYAKGVVEGLLGQLGIEAVFEESHDVSLHPSKQATITIDDNKLGVVGELHPKVSLAFDISELVYLFEIDLTVLLPITLGYKMFQPIPRFPAIIRDIALVVDDGITHQQIQNIIQSFPVVRQVAVFDVYSGEQVPPGKKSLAYRITFQSSTKTLTDDAVDKIQQQILKKLSRDLEATLRT